MAVKKTIDQLVAEMRNNIEVLANKYVSILLEEQNDETLEQKKEQKKEIKNRMDALKKEVKIIESMKGTKIDKKKERELERQQNDIVNWVKKMPSSISEIVKTIPKH